MPFACPAATNPSALPRWKGGPQASLSLPQRMAVRTSSYGTTSTASKFIRLSIPSVGELGHSLPTSIGLVGWARMAESQPRKLFRGIELRIWFWNAISLDQRDADAKWNYRHPN